MLIVISPAKTLDYQSALPIKEFTLPPLLTYSQQLIEICRQFTPTQLASLMKISDPLAALNTARFADWHPHFTLENARQAIFAFQGDVYTGLQAKTLSVSDLEFAQQHLRILSGLYGVLRPLDLMQPYRLEMGTRLPNHKGKDLYAFWGDVISEQIQQAMVLDKILINLASEEYFKAINQNHLSSVKIIKPIFLDKKQGKYKVIGLYAKKARGLMSRFIITHRLNKPEQLHDFNWNGYQFDPTSSSDAEFIFKRCE